jgi:hypothetical protein
MSVHVYLTLKDASKAQHFNNKFIEKFGNEEDGQTLYFISDQDNQAWLDDINNNPDSHQNHLKPKDGELTMDALKNMFTAWTKVGHAQMDIGFSRMPIECMQKALVFIDDNKSAFQEVDGIHELIERSETGDKFKHLLYLDKHFPNSSSKLPVTHPKYKAVHTDGAVAYIRGMNDAEVGVLYGNVKTPTYMKARTTINPLDGEFIKDPQGRHILIVPLLPMDNTAQDIAIDVYNSCASMFFQEPMGLFMAKIYPSMKPSDGYNIGNDETIEILEIATQKCLSSATITRFDPDALIAELVLKRYNPTELHTKAIALAKKYKTSANECWWFIYAIGALRANKYGTSGDIAQLYLKIAKSVKSKLAA